MNATDALLKRFDELARICEPWRQNAWEKLTQIPEQAYGRFWRLYDLAFDNGRLSSKQMAWLNDFERRLLRVQRGGPWAVESDVRQMELIQ